MDRHEIIETARAIARSGRPFVLATVDSSGAPHVRWMGGMVIEPPFTALMPAGVASRKMTQIRSNPCAQLLLTSEDFTCVATLDGACEIVTESDAKQRLWEALPALNGHYSGPDDPTFGAIRFRPRRVELLMSREHCRVPLVAEL